MLPLGYSGTGYSASLTGVNFVGTTTEGSTTVLVSDTSGLAPGQPILRTANGEASDHIARYTKIVSVTPDTSIEIDTSALTNATDEPFRAVTLGYTPLDYTSRDTGETRLERDFNRMQRTPDVIITMLGLNDDTNVVEYSDIVKNTFTKIRELCPHAIIFNAGVPNTPANGAQSGSPNYVSAFAQNNENVVAGAINDLNDPYIINIPNSNDPNAGEGVSWLWGDGDAGSPTGNGNTDEYISDDGTHPTDAGHLFLAEKIVQKIYMAIAAFYR